jgi:hypothetical protein
LTNLSKQLLAPTERKPTYYRVLWLRHLRGLHVTHN